MNKMRWAVLAGSTVVGLAVGCGKDNEGATGGSTINGLDASLVVSELSDAEARKLCEAVVQRAEKEISREVVCTLASISANPNSTTECESDRSECVAAEAEATDGRDEVSECNGIGAEDFAGCSATVGQMDACMAAIIGEVASITCEDTDGRADEADIEAACKPLLDDPDCLTATEVGHVVAGHGYVTASNVEAVQSGSGGSGMGGSDSGSGGSNAATGGSSSATGGTSSATGGSDAGTGGTTGNPYTGGVSDCTTCSMLDCLLSPKRGLCQNEDEACFTQVVDHQAGRTIVRGCEEVSKLKQLVEANSSDCSKIESLVLTDDTTCTLACDGSTETGKPNCNHPPQLVTEAGTELFQ